MVFYQAGARVRMTRAITRAMARSGNKHRSSAAIEQMIQKSKNRFGGTVRSYSNSNIEQFPNT